tara:strand:+ start:2393 stop:2794 length:402 start_codon:yes stop_codon:yes gene_type:complete
MHDAIKTQLILSGIIAGSIIFHIVIIAPSIFKLLGANDIRNLLRHIFPRLFVFLSLLGFISITCNFLIGVTIYIQYLVSALSFIIPSICYLIIPETNKAKDSGDGKKFNILHKISVTLTMVLLLINLLWLFFI